GGRVAGATAGAVVGGHALRAAHALVAVVGAGAVAGVAALHAAAVDAELTGEAVGVLRALRDAHVLHAGHRGAAIGCGEALDAAAERVAVAGARAQVGRVAGDARALGQIAHLVAALRGADAVEALTELADLARAAVVVGLAEAAGVADAVAHRVGLV